jgi:hypothetical protein
MRPYPEFIAAGLMCVCLGVAFADDRIPTGTLRATYIATNPVQAFVDPKSGELRGPGADVAREIARRLNAPVKISGVDGAGAVAAKLGGLEAAGEEEIGGETAVKWLTEGTVDVYGANRQRLAELAVRNPGYRLLPDNFYGVEQSVVAAKGNKAMIDFVDGVLDEAKSAGLIARSIEQAGLVGVDVAPLSKR